MKNYISNIQIRKNYIVLTYSDQSEQKILYNEENKQKLFFHLLDGKEAIIKEKNKLKLAIFLIKLIKTITTFATIFSYIYLNSFLLKLFLSILSIDILFINQLIYVVLLEDYENLEKILEITNSLKLEKECDNVIYLKDYLENKKLQSIFNYYDYDYPRETRKKEEMDTKILKFKK